MAGVLAHHGEPMMDDLGIGSSSVRFTCGHANPTGNRYCNVCGAAGSRTCPRCRASNREDASFCGSCGARLVGETVASVAAALGGGRPRAERPERPAMGGRASTPTEPLGSDDDLPDTPTSRSGESRLADLLFPGGEDVSGDEDEWADRERRRTRKRVLLWVVVVVALASAVLVAVGQFGLASYGGFLERLVDRLVAQRSAPSAGHGERQKGEASVAPPAAAPEQETAGAASGPVAEVQAAGHQAVRDSSTATLPAASRSGHEQSAAGAEEGAGGTVARADVGSARTSEERMADFLVEALGPGPAVAKAQSNASWYEADRPEHAYWQEVAEAVKRREGR